MLAIRLPSSVEKRLQKLAERSGRTKTYYAREAILRHLEDLEDAYEAERILHRVRAGRERTYTLDEVVPLSEGDAVLFAVNERPVAGARGDSGAGDKPSPARLPQTGRKQERLAYPRRRLPRHNEDRRRPAHCPRDSDWTPPGNLSLIPGDSPDYLHQIRY